MDLIDGMGLYTYATRDSYNGMWEKGKMHGRGVYTYSNDTTYHGHWLKGMNLCMSEYVCIIDVYLTVFVKHSYFINVIFICTFVLCITHVSCPDFPHSLMHACVLDRHGFSYSETTKHAPSAGRRHGEGHYTLKNLSKHFETRENGVLVGERKVMQAQ